MIILSLSPHICKNNIYFIIFLYRMKILMKIFIFVGEKKGEYQL